MGKKILHFVSNVISALIWKKTLRDKVRVMIRYPRTFEYKRFVRDYAHKHGICDCGISSRVGRGCGNFVVILGNKYVFKFPLFTDGREIAEREKRITDAFAKISPIKIPKMKIIPYKDIVIRRYDFAKGVLMSDVDPYAFWPHREHVAKQIANFMYVIGESDPVELRDLKPTLNAKSKYLYGWFHGDIWQNFMLDPKTFDIRYFIDWEVTKFQSFMAGVCVATRTWEKRGYMYMGITVLSEYSKLYLKKHKK